MFHVGQLVVCVDDKPDPGRRFHDGNMLRAGAVYTIDGPGEGLPYHNLPCFCLKEICRDPSTLGYRATRFRPVDDSKLEIFREMLETKPAELEPAQ